MVVHLQYSVAVYLTGGVSLTMAFRENRVLAEMLAH